MAVGSRRITVEFYGDDKTLSRTAGSVDTSTRKLSDTFKKVGTTAAKGLGVGIAAAGVALVAFGKGAVAEARDAQKIGAQTEAVIKSTGGAANVSAAQVGDLANALSMKAGIDDELIQSGANVLLTFKGISNEVGKNNDIFNQATGIALDMSVALGQDMKSSAIQVGKALNDPIAGMSALSRVGVTFSEKQKATITRLQETGDKLGAQKLILKELNSEFAGSAEAQATAGDKARVAWGNFQEFIGMKLLPLMDKLAVFFVQVIVPALMRFSAWFEREGVPAIKKFVAFAQAYFQVLIAWFRKHWPEIREVIAEVLKTIVTNWKNFAAIVVQIWRKWGDDIFRVLAPILKNIATQIKAVMKIIRGVIEVVTGIITGDWGKAWHGIKLIFSGAWQSIVGNLKTQIRVVKALFGSFVDALKDIWKRIWAAIVDLARKGFDLVVTGIRKWLGLLKTIFLGYISIYRTIFERIWGAVRDVTGRIWDAVRGKVTNVADAIRDALGNIFSNAADRVLGIWDRARDRLSNIWDGVRNVFERVMSFVRDRVPDAFGRAADAVGKQWDRLKAMAAKPVNFVINQVWNNGIAKVLNLIPGVHLNDNVSDIKFNRGGYTGPGGEFKPAGIVHADEFVLNSKSRRSLELHRPGDLEFMNRTGEWPKYKGYRAGGMVRRVQGALNWVRSQVGIPYEWGGVGGGGHGYDCSGLQSALTNFLLRRPLHRRVGSTGDFPWPDFVPGVGTYTIGSTPNYGGSGIGHMASTLAGVNVESAGGIGVRMGPSARGYRDPHFTQIYHLATAGSFGKGLDFAGSMIPDVGMFDGVIGAATAIPKFLGGLKDIWDKIHSMGGDGFWPMIAKLPGSVMDEVKDYGLSKLKDAGAWIKSQVTGVPISVFGQAGHNVVDLWHGIFDRGGVLDPGPNLVYNATGARERLYTHRRPTAGDVLVAEIHVYLDSREIQQGLLRLKRRNGGTDLGLK